ncbi:MAG: IS110 family transposase [Erysipelotrichaceae bacterium]|nr:IS110 family transposase [Erysipelotrichaceae bacterium]
MYIVGVDAAKGKSTVCMIDEHGQVFISPKDIGHTRNDLKSFIDELNKTGRKEDVCVVMEATGIYHWPVFNQMKKEGFKVFVINPLKMKAFAKDVNFRNVKTDKIDAGIIALYGAQKYNFLAKVKELSSERDELLRLARAYSSMQKPKVNLKQQLDVQLETMMPGIKEVFSDDEKFYDFLLEFHHYDKIERYSEETFMKRFIQWAKKKGYRFKRSTPAKIYELSKTNISSIPYDETAVLCLSSIVNSLKAIDKGLKDILARMHKIASLLPEYEVLSAMEGFGYTLVPLIIAEVGDIRRLRSKKSLVCMAGIDVPHYESGKFKAGKRKITKKGNAHLRRHLYLAMDSIMKVKPKTDTAIYDFMIRKKNEHKLNKQVRVAGMRKFLHIYYARVKEKYKELGLWNIEEFL